MLVHICCSVDSHYFLQKLQEDYPDDEIIGFFYDPNIQPYSEYKLRLEDVKYSCNKLGITLIEGDYDLESWLKIIKGLEYEPEKGNRCTVCFDRRLEISVKKAIELGHDKFTTTLLISPKKSQEKLITIGEKLTKKYDCQFIFKDYRSGNGMEMQGKQVKQNNLYRQNYCGCMFGLIPQREQQNKLADELLMPIGQQIQPDSIEERLELYKKRNSLKQCHIIKQRFLNYRLLSGNVMINKKVVPSYFLCYSTLKNNKTNGKIEKIINNIGYLNRDEVKIIDLNYFNKLFQTNYIDIYELIYNPPRFEQELNIRNLIVNNYYDLSTILVLQALPTSKIEIKSDTKIFEDVREVLSNF